MNLFGRQAHIDQDFVNKIGIDSRGVRSYYNTDPRFNNIVEISPDIFDHNYSVVLMKPRHALAYCKSQDVYNCDPSEGENNGVAVIMMHKESGDVIAMNILAGENLRIKLNSQLIDAKVNDSCFKIFSKKGNDFFLENYLIGQQNPTEIIDISEIKQSGDNHSFPKKLNSFFPLAFLLSAVGIAGLASVVVSNPKGQVINHRETALGRGVHED